MRILVTMEYDRDPAKSEANERKHRGVTFDEAVTCLLDAMALVRGDDDAIGKHRYVLVGMSQSGRVLTVCYTMRGELPRLISARKATKKEESSYAQGI
jgi:uncharacterized protein